MSSEKHRRSARILELDAQRSQQAEDQNKGKETCEVETEDVVTEEDHFSLKRRRKRAKIRPVQNLVVNKVEDLVEKVSIPRNENHHTSAAAMSSGTALPERSKLHMLLGFLQRRDSHKIFAEPVDSEEVKGYYDIIEEPMDFGTISMKLNEGSYKALDEFEARAIRDLARKLFDALKTDPENFGSELSMARLRAGYRDERRSIYFEEDRRGTFRALGSFLNENESIVSSVFNSSKPLMKIMQNNIGYKESLLRFVKDLGPTAQFIAWQKLKRCTTEVYNHQTGTPLRELQNQEYQIPNAASLRKNNTVASSSNFLTNSTTKNISGKMNILGNTWYAGKASKFDTINMNDVLSHRFAQTTNSMKNLVDYSGKSVQTLRDRTAILKQDMAGQGIGNPNFPTSLGDGSPYLSTTRSTLGNHDEYNSGTINKGKNVQMADASSSYPMRNPVAPHTKSIQAIREEVTSFNQNVANQGTGSSYFSTALLGDRKSYLSATPNTYNDPDKFISGANNKGKNVQIAEVSSSFSMEHRGGDFGESEKGMRQMGAVSNAYMADQGSGSAYFSSDLFGAYSATQSTQSKPDKSISHALNKGKNVLVADVNSLDPMDPDDYHRKSGMREVGASFKVDMSDQSIGSSFFSTSLPIDKNSPATRHTHDSTGGLIASATDKSQNDQMVEMTFSDPRMLESLFASDYGAASSKPWQWLPPAMGSSWSQALSTRGLDSNYLGGGVQRVHASSGRGGTKNESKVMQAGQAWNWFKPTQLGPQHILSSSFLEQSGPTKVDLTGQAGSSKWGGWGTTTPNGQVVEGSFMNETHQTSNQQGDLSIGAPLGNNYLQQSPLGTKYHQQSPLENNYHQQSPLGNNYQQQSSLANNYRQQAPMGNDHQQQFPLGNDYRQHSPLANNYLRQSSLGNNHQQQSSLANDNERHSSLVANGYQRQPPLASNYERRYSMGNNYQQKSSLANNYRQQSPLINNHRRQSPLGHNYQQQPPLASNYKQQSPLANNYMQQSPLRNNHRQQSRLGIDNQQQSPADANILHQHFRQLTEN